MPTSVTALPAVRQLLHRLLYTMTTFVVAVLQLVFQPCQVQITVRRAVGKVVQLHLLSMRGLVPVPVMSVSNVNRATSVTLFPGGLETEVILVHVGLDDL